MKKAFYRDLEVIVHPTVYDPSDDSFLIADEIWKLDLEGKTVLDLGTGCGILAVVCAKRGAEKVLAADINDKALANARMNAKILGVEDRLQFRKSNLFSDIPERFDLIVSNTPYLPVEKGEITDNTARAWSGGWNGRVFIDRFLSQLEDHLEKKGTCLMVQSSLADNDKTLDILNSMGCRVSVASGKKFDFEEIIVIKAEF